MSEYLLLHQEVVLLALNDDKGTFTHGMYLYSVAGAMLSELLLQQKIICNDDEKRTVAVIDTSKTGCEILDEVVQDIDKSEKHLGLQDWINATVHKKELNHRVAESLCEKGILNKTTDKVLFIFTRRIYPEIESSFENAIRQRMSDVMFFPDAKADERTAVLIAFAHMAGLLAPNFAPVELSQHQSRINEIAEGQHLASGETKAAIEAIQTAIHVATIATTAATTAAVINN